MTIKTHLYAILEKAEEGDRLSRTVDLFYHHPHRPECDNGHTRNRRGN